MAAGVGVRAKTLVIGSRGSQLALWQARHIAEQLERLSVASRIEIVKTAGDLPQSWEVLPKATAGGKGLFTKEIEDALLAGTIDIAVHSLKDLPAETRDGLTLAAIPEREDPRDAIAGRRLSELASGARIGTSSGRRAAQLRLLRPDLNIQPIRGNVDTRIRKLREGQYDAIVLAVAGLRRLGLESEIVEIFSPDEMCPAAGQGALAIETRENDPAQAICSQLDHPPSRQAVVCERTALACVGGGCQLPIGAFAQIENGVLHARAIVLSADGAHIVRAKASGSPHCAAEVGRAVGEELLAHGAGRILTESR